MNNKKEENNKKTKDEFEKIEVYFCKGSIGHFDEIEIFATIEGYEYLIECLTEFLEELKENELEELNLDSGIDVEYNCPSLRFFLKK